MRLIGAMLGGGGRHIAELPSRACAIERNHSDVLPGYIADFAKALRGCHRAGGIAPISFADYEIARRYAEPIRFVTENKSMPPWFAVGGIGRFSNDPSLSGEEIATLAAWTAAKAPAGDLHDAPAALDWAAGWSIPQPDLVVKMTRPVELPASGEVDYTYEIVPTHFAEDRWCKWQKCCPRRGLMCITRSSIFGHRIQIGCAMRRWARRSRQRR